MRKMATIRKIDALSPIEGQIRLKLPLLVVGKLLHRKVSTMLVTLQFILRLILGFHTNLLLS